MGHQDRTRWDGDDCSAFVIVMQPDFGPAHGEESRVGTVSFVHESRSSRDISLAVNERGFAIRHGHMYSYRLCDALGIDPSDGVVRVSFLHYNSPDEMERLIGVLDELL